MSGPAQPRPQSSVGYNLGAIMLMLLALGVGAAYLIDAASRTMRADANRVEAGDSFTRTLGGHDLDIPANWFRYDEQKVEGFAKQIDLRLQLPLGAKGAALPVDITLLPRSRVRPSSSLLDGVYLHQFAPEQLSGPPGLIGKPLKPEEGYAGETVWFDALAADPFVAKCSKSAAPDQPGQCLRTVYLGPGMAAVFAFPDTVLANWKQFDPEVDARLKQIGAL